jgi:hypothetical protein
MPLPTATQLTRMRTQANSHGATSIYVCSKTEVNTSKGLTVTYARDGAAIAGMFYQRKVMQQQAGGAIGGPLVQVLEDHVTLPYGTSVDATKVLEDAATGLYYDVVDMATVDENLKILIDCTVKRIKV